MYFKSNKTSVQFDLINRFVTFSLGFNYLLWQLFTYLTTEGKPKWNKELIGKKLQKGIVSHKTNKSTYVLPLWDQNITKGPKIYKQLKFENMCLWRLFWTHFWWNKCYNKYSQNYLFKKKWKQQIISKRSVGDISGCHECRQTISRLWVLLSKYTAFDHWTG